MNSLCNGLQGHIKVLAGLGDLNLAALRISLLQALEVVDWIQYPEIIRLISLLCCWDCF